MKVDGTVLAASDYTPEEGSTKVTLSPVFLENLREGSHYIEIVSSDGSAVTGFAVNESPQPEEPDNPGGPGNREEPKEPGNREEPGNPDNPNNPGNFDKPDSAVNRAIEQTENPRTVRFGDFDVQAGCGAFP